MSPKNVESQNFVIRSENIQMTDCSKKQVQETDQSMRDKVIKSNCRQIARGVLIRLNIHAETKSLTTVLGSCNARNNLVATTEWVRNLSPEQDEVSENVVDEFTSQLRGILREKMEWDRCN